MIATGKFSTSKYSDYYKETVYYKYQFRAKGKKVLDTFKIYMIQYKKKDGKWYSIHYPSGKCTWSD